MNSKSDAIAQFDFGDLLEAALLFAIGYVCFSYYELVGRLAALRGSDFSGLLHTRLDDAMPFLPAFVLPYSLAYIIPIWPAVVAARRGGLVELRRVFLAYIGLLFVHFAFYLALPTSAAGIMRAPASIPSGILPGIVALTYRLAPPWNAFPSFHVAGCWFFYRIFAQFDKERSKIYFVWFWLMFIGTVAIKIHWLLDGVGGWLLAEAWYRWFFVPLEARGSCEWTFSSTGRRVASHLVPLVFLGAVLGMALLKLR